MLTPAQAAMETYVLQQVVLWGTGSAAGGLGTPVAGKTGTTEHSSDAWFIGYTPNLTTAVWMGYASSSRPMVNFRGLKSVQGGTIPAQLWHNYMAAALASDPQYEGAFPLVYYLRRPDPDAAGRRHGAVPPGARADDHHRAAGNLHHLSAEHHGSRLDHHRHPNHPTDPDHLSADPDHPPRPYYHAHPHHRGGPGQPDQPVRLTGWSQRWRAASAPASAGPEPTLPGAVQSPSPRPRPED